MKQNWQATPEKATVGRSVNATVTAGSGTANRISGINEAIDQAGDSLMRFMFRPASDSTLMHGRGIARNTRDLGNGQQVMFVHRQQEALADRDGRLRNFAKVARTRLW